MDVPRWFAKELELIDPRYFVVWNDMYRYWEIKCRIKIDRKIEVPGQEQDPETLEMKSKTEIFRARAENPTIAIEKRLNDYALNNLRRRKYLRLKYKNDDDELKEIEEENRRASEQAHQIGMELMAEGFIKLDKIGNKRSQTFDMATQGA